MKSALKNIFFAILITVLFFAVLEITWRIKSYITTKDPYLLFYGRSYFELKIKCFANRIEDLAKKHKGEKQDKTGETTICTFGGSTTKCTPYVKESDSWPNRLKHHLNNLSGKEIKVINKGYSGASCSDADTILKNYLFVNRHIPQIVIFYIGFNDSANVSLCPTRVKTRSKLSVPVLSVINCRLMELSLFYTSAKEKYCLLMKKDINRAWDFKNIDSGYVGSNLEQFKMNVQSAIDMTKDFDIKFILCSEPISRGYQKKYPEFSVIFHEAIRIMHNMALKNNVDFLDLNNDVFIRYPEFEKYYVDDVHLNEKGNDLIAQYLAEHIQRKYS